MEVFAQCCGAGNPLSVISNENSTTSRTLRIGLDYRYNFSDTYYERVNKVKLNFSSRLSSANYNFLNLNIGYGITKRFTAALALGYYINKTEIFAEEINGIKKLRASGLGDLDLTLSYKAISKINQGIELTPYINVRFPVSKFDAEDEDIKLPISMQSSSGSFKYTGGLFFSSNLPKKFFISSTVFFEYAQRIVSKNFNYKYENTLYALFGAYNRITSYFYAGSQVSYEMKTRSKRENGIILYGSGH